MPHITKEKKTIYANDLHRLRIPNPVMDKGELTYILYWIAAKSCIYNKSYASISCAISCLNDAANELRRLHLDPYENKAIIRNGSALENI